MVSSQYHASYFNISKRFMNSDAHNWGIPKRQTWNGKNCLDSAQCLTVFWLHHLPLPSIGKSTTAQSNTHTQQLSKSLVLKWVSTHPGTLVTVGCTRAAGSQTDLGCCSSKLRAGRSPRRRVGVGVCTSPRFLVYRNRARGCIVRVCYKTNQKGKGGAPTVRRSRPDEASAAHIAPRCNQPSKSHSFTTANFTRWAELYTKLVFVCSCLYFSPWATEPNTF